MRLAFSGGGTGGHVYPALTVAEALRREAGRDGELEMIYLGSKSRLERDIVNRAGIVMHGIESAPIRGRMPWEMAANAARIVSGTNQARGALQDFAPQVVLATGGYASFPVALAARTRGIPLVVYLPDLYPGLGGARDRPPRAARLRQRRREPPPPPRGKTIVTGYPVRDEFWQATRAGGREQARPQSRGEGPLHRRRLNRAHAASTMPSPTTLTGLLELC